MQDSGRRSEWMGQTVERVLSNGKRVFSAPFKAWLVDEAIKPGTSVAGLALRHGINANLLRRWMLLARDQGSAPEPPRILRRLLRLRMEPS
jgi:transposase